MKKLFAFAIILSTVSIAAISAGYKWKAAKPQAVVLLDSALIFNVDTIRNFKVTPAALAESYKLYILGIKTFRPDRKPCESLPIFLKSIRTCPMSEVYGEYADALSECQEYSNAEAISSAHSCQSLLKKAIRTSEYIEAARYALAHDDTMSTIGLLGLGMMKDTTAYRIVDKEEAFRTLENYPPYYYMMDGFLRNDLGQQSSLRTMRFTKPSALPFALSLDIVFPKKATEPDTIGPPPPPPSLQDEAISDLMRGNRWGRYSRWVERDYKYVATLNLSSDFYTYIYKTWDVVNEVRHPSDEIPGESERARKMRMEREEKLREAAVSIIYYLVNLDKYGKKIAEQQIACQCSPVHISTGTVDRSGLIEVRKIDQEWKKDPLVDGYKNNEVVNRKNRSVMHYQVQSDGTILPVNDGSSGPM